MKDLFGHHLTCAFGLPWLRHFTGAGCLFCRAESDRLAEEFDQQVRDGMYDREGYTPKERKHKERGFSKV